jgi:hypothetical protein
LSGSVSGVLLATPTRVLPQFGPSGRSHNSLMPSIRIGCGPDSVGGRRNSATWMRTGWSLTGTPRDRSIRTVQTPPATTTTGAEIGPVLVVTPVILPPLVSTPVTSV